MVLPGVRLLRREASPHGLGVECPPVGWGWRGRVGKTERGRQPAGLPTSREPGVVVGVHLQWYGLELGSNPPSPVCTTVWSWGVKTGTGFPRVVFDSWAAESGASHRLMYVL